MVFKLLIERTFDSLSCFEFGPNIVAAKDPLTLVLKCLDNANFRTKKLFSHFDFSMLSGLLISIQS